MSICCENHELEAMPQKGSQPPRDTIAGSREDDQSQFGFPVAKRQGYGFATASTSREFDHVASAGSRDLASGCRGC